MVYLTSVVCPSVGAKLLIAFIYFFSVTFVQQRPSIPKLEVVSRVAAIPIVESGIVVTEKMYRKIRVSALYS